jgi:hypothetical protein
MEGRFYDKLTILWSGKGVAARGPVEWGAEDTSISLHVAILQKGVTAVGWTGNDVPHGADEFLVAASVEGNRILEEGPATATGWAFVHGDGIEMYEWTVPVTLMAHKPEAGLSEDLAPKGRARAHASK